MNELQEINLSKKDTIQYLREVFRLEHKKYALNETQERLRNEILNIDDVPPCDPPVRQQYSYPAPPTATDDKIFITVIRFIAILTLPLWLIEVELFGRLFNSISSSGSVMFLVVTLIIAIAVSGFLGYLKSSKGRLLNARVWSEYNLAKNEIDEQNKELDKIYHKNMKIYQDNLEAIRLENERREMQREYARAAINELDDTRVEIDKSLNQLYDYNIIHGDYRSFNAVGMILHYFETRRVDTLKEALNKYDDDVFKGMMMDVMERISHSQEMMYDALEENNAIMQSWMGNMQSSIERTERIEGERLDYERMAADNSTQIRKSIQSMEFMQTMDMLERARQ